MKRKIVNFFLLLLITNIGAIDEIIDPEYVMNKDYYAVLGVDKNASEKEIKKAYRDLAKVYHPDKNLNNKEVTGHFHELNEAYEVLKDDSSRKEYDRIRNRNFSNKNQFGRDSNSNHKTRFPSFDPFESIWNIFNADLSEGNYFYNGFRPEYDAFDNRRWWHEDRQFYRNSNPSFLNIGDVLFQKQKLVSPNKKYRLSLERDCKLYITKKEDRKTTTIWSSQRHSPFHRDTDELSGNCYLKLLENCELVVMSGKKPSFYEDVLWSSNSIKDEIDSKCQASLTDDGDLLVIEYDLYSDLSPKCLWANFGCNWEVKFRLHSIFQKFFDFANGEIKIFSNGAKKRFSEMRYNFMTKGLPVLLDRFDGLKNHGKSALKLLRKKMSRKPNKNKNANYLNLFPLSECH